MSQGPWPRHWAFEQYFAQIFASQLFFFGMTLGKTPHLLPRTKRDLNLVSSMVRARSSDTIQLRMTHTSTYLLQALEGNDQALSRTAASGASDTTVSVEKKPLRLRGEALMQAVDRNRAATARFIEGLTAENLTSGKDLHALILAIAGLTLHGLLPAGIYRSWDLPEDRLYGPLEDSQRISIHEIDRRLLQVSDEIVTVVRHDPFTAASIAEWEIGIGPLHPFYDACGRISRAVSALILSTAGLKIVRHSSRDAYLGNGARGKAAFLGYLKSQGVWD